MKILQNICFVLLFLATFSSAYAGSCWDGDVADCKVKAEQGDATAQYNLGVMYANGEGVIQDYKQSVNWYRKAAEQGDADAQFNLGVLYSKGQGVIQDYKEAVKWFRLSAEQGNASAQYNLGVMYAQGKGVPKDYVMAHMYWNIAAVSGDEDAIKYRGIVEKDMTATQLEKAQDLARDWMNKHQ